MKKKRRKIKRKQPIPNLIEKLALSKQYEINRNFLECDNCNLVEDQKIGVPVFTRFRLSKHSYGKPTNMSFIELDKEKLLFQCPNCGNTVQSEPLDLDSDIEL